jgi:hypothetical protein
MFHGGKTRFTEYQDFMSSLSSIIKASECIDREMTEHFVPWLGRWLDFQPGTDASATQFLMEQLRESCQFSRKSDISLAEFATADQRVPGAFEQCRTVFNDAFRLQRAAGLTRLRFEGMKQRYLDNSTSRRAAAYRAEMDQAEQDMVERVVQANEARDELLAKEYEFRAVVVDFLRAFLRAVGKDAQNALNDAVLCLEKADGLVTGIEFTADPKVEELQELLKKLEEGEL